MSREQYRAGLDRIERDYEQARQGCAALSGNAQRVCTEEALGRRDVAHAQLDAQRAGTGRARRRAAMARIGAEYEVAKARCEDARPGDKDVCLKRAAIEYRNARSSVRRNMVAAGGPTRSATD